MQPLHRHTEQRIQAIRRMLHYLAHGDGSARLKVGDGSERLARFEKELNILADEFSALLLEYGKGLAPLGHAGRLLQPVPAFSGDNARFEHIWDVYNYILDNFDGPLPSVPELAHKFGTNESTLRSGFQSLFGMSVHRFCNEQRLLLAYELIRKSGEPFKAISFMCGFNDYYTFLRAFKKRFGCAPGNIERLPV